MTTFVILLDIFMNLKEHSEKNITKTIFNAKM